MIKFIGFYALLVCALSAPTSENNSKTTFVLRAQEKPIFERSQVGTGVFVNPEKAEKREKRENVPPAPSSSLDNKRTKVNSQPEYPENKPPTFVHPVPVDQIIKNSHAAPQIHSAQKQNVEKEVSSEEEHKSINDDDSTENEDSDDNYSTHRRYEQH